MCDHKPLQRFLECKTKNDMVNRWSLAIQEFDIEFQWVESENNISDCLSRLVERQMFSPHDPNDEFKEFRESAKSPIAPKTGIRGEIASKIDHALPVVHEPPADTPIYGVFACTSKKIASSELMSKLPTTLAWDLPEVQNKPPAVSIPLPKADKDTVVVKSAIKCSFEEFLQMQKSDAYCARIMKTKHNNTAENGEFLIKNKLLYRVFHGNEHKKERIAALALVIPSPLRASIVWNTHVELLHTGRDKLLAALKPRVYWPRMQQQIAAMVRGCEICHCKRLAKEDQHSSVHVKPPLGPGKRLALDLWSCGPGKCLTAICMHSQYPFAEIVDDKKGKTVTNAFQNILSYVSDPVEILTDNGGEFISKEFKALCEAKHIKQVFSAPYHPQTNGVLERFHKYLNTVVRLTKNFSLEGEWWPSVRSALETYRRMPHTSTGETPLFLFTGQEPKYTIDHLLPTRPKEIWNTAENTFDLAQLRTAYALARKNCSLARLKNRVKVFKARKLQAGDRVYRRLQRDVRSKDDMVWIPGYRIIEMKSSHTAKIEHTKTGVKADVDVHDLKWADPVSELLNNSSLDVFPGRSKLYFSAKDLPDLNWPAMQELPELSKDTADKLFEAARDRSNDVKPQKAEKSPDTPSGGSQTTGSAHSTQKGGEGILRRSKRERQMPNKFRDFCYVQSVIEHHT